MGLVERLMMNTASRRCTTKYREIAITKDLYITKHNYNTLKLQFVQPIQAKIKNIH